MTDALTPLAAEPTSTEEHLAAPIVKVLLTQIDGADLSAALAILARQVYEPIPEVVVVGESPDVLGEDLAWEENLEDAIADHGDGVDYFWILHSDARPRPDALSALVAEILRNDAALGGSKLLVAGSHEELESVGSATDVFGEPYTGLDEGEIDLQQYDVVREVAFVHSASMLVRRDLAQGLGGLDPLLPPIAAGLDFSQRTRLAGGRVVSIPSSEVYHQGRCNQRGRGWAEQAGRLRAMLTGYSLLTLVWLIPYDFLVSVLDSLANLLFLRWRPAARHMVSFGWNFIHLPSTLGQRRRFSSVRVAGDEELFRFQTKGSVRLREIGSEFSSRVLSMFDDDQALARSSRRLWGSPGIWGAVLAVVIVTFGIRGLVFAGVPNIGFNFPFEAPSVALDRWLAGWNQSGLGSPATVHPSVGLTGLFSWIWLGAEGAARTVMTILAGVVAIGGLGRLGGRIGLRGPGRYLGGLVLIAGPGTALLTGEGSWLALMAAAVTPWAVRSAFVHPHDEAKSQFTRIGWALVLGIPVAAFSPLLVVLPLLTVIVWKVLGGRGSRIVPGFTVLVAGVVAVPFLLGDPGWLLDPSRRLGLTVAVMWPILIALAVAPLMIGNETTRRIGVLGALLSVGALAAVRVPYGGPGVEEGLLVVASFGAALLVAAGMDRLSMKPSQLMAAVASSAVLLLSVGVVGDGRLGLAPGDVNSQLAFAGALAGPEGAGRILIASTDMDDIPGEARSGPGFWYRVVDGEAITNDQAWLPDPLLGDQALDAALSRIAAGAELRPGEVLAPFAIDWIVLDGPMFRLDEVFLAQIDLIPTPLDPASRVFENPSSVALAQGATDDVWRRDGAGFVGEPASGRVALALNHATGWQPESGSIEWWSSVSAVDGAASFAGSTLDQVLALISAALAASGLVLIATGRGRS